MYRSIVLIKGFAFHRYVTSLVGSTYYVRLFKMTDGTEDVEILRDNAHVNFWFTYIIEIEILRHFHPALSLMNHRKSV